MKILLQCTFYLLIYLQYVDDSIAIFPQNQINMILEKFNSFHLDLNFTCEIEIESQISFLNLQIIKNPGDFLSFDLHVLPSDSGLFINYFIHCPFVYKMNTLNYFLRRIYSLCDESYIGRNIDDFSRAASSNSYPLLVLNSTIRNFHRRMESELYGQAAYSSYPLYTLYQ